MIKPPSPATLKKYGLTAELWLDIIRHQKYACPICERKFDDKVRPCVDHVHVKNYKKLPDEERRTWIRGIVCIWCNKVALPRGITTHKAYNTYQYLWKFEIKQNEIQNLQ